MNIRLQSTRRRSYHQASGLGVHLTQVRRKGKPPRLHASPSRSGIEVGFVDRYLPLLPVVLRNGIQHKSNRDG